MTIKDRYLVDYPMAKIRTGDRFRVELGDIAGLADSIAEVGLLQPITVTTAGDLLLGGRRLEACRSLGWATIPVISVDGLDAAVDRVRAERDENTCRLDMTVSEKVALAEALEELERPRAEERQRAARVRGGKARQGKESASCSGEQEAGGNARDIAARAAGLAPTTYYRARMVTRSVHDPDLPEEVRAIAAAAMTDMDATGRVVPAYQKVKGLRDIAAPPAALSAAPASPAAVVQRKTITKANERLSGIAFGLERITALDEHIASDEAAEWLDGLVKSRRAIERLINLLRERTNA